MQKLLKMYGFSEDKINRKNRPTFIVRHDDRLFKMDADLFNDKFSTNFFDEFDNETQMIEIKSTKDLAENLRSFNKNLDDSVNVYCADPTSTNSESVRSAIRMIRDDSSNPLLVVRDPELAAKFDMKPGSFYCYFKPSYLNGFK